MSSIMLKGVIRDGRVEVGEPIDLPEGTEVVVTTQSRAPNDCHPISEDEAVCDREATESWELLEFMTEEDQGDEPRMIQQWIDDLQSNRRYSP